MPCYVCDPKCKLCKSRLQKISICKVCNKASFHRDIIDSKCPKCGGTMEVEKPAEVLCKYSGKMCSDVCGKQTTDPNDGIFVDCKRNPNSRVDIGKKG